MSIWGLLGLQFRRHNSSHLRDVVGGLPNSNWYYSPIYKKAINCTVCQKTWLVKIGVLAKRDWTQSQKTRELSLYAVAKIQKSHTRNDRMAPFTYPGGNVPTQPVLEFSLQTHLQPIRTRASTHCILGASYWCCSTVIFFFDWQD